MVSLDTLKINMKIALRTWSGKIGFTLLLIQILLALYAVAAYYPEGMIEYGRATKFFYIYPQSAPPCWATENPSIEANLTLNDVNVTVVQGIPDDLALLDRKSYDLYKMYESMGFKMVAKVYEASITVDKPGLPSDVLLALVVSVPVEYMPDRVIVYSGWLYIERPDGLPVVIFYRAQLYEANTTNIVVYGSVVNETVDGQNVTVLKPLTLKNYANSPYIATTFAKSLELLKEALNLTDEVFERYIPQVIFAAPGGGDEPLALQGEYRVRAGVFAIVSPTVPDEEVPAVLNASGISAFQLTVMPNCYGLMGTDTKARPIGLGLLLGLPYAFLLGFTVTFISTFIGAIYGTLAGYWKDLRGEALMRIVDIVLSLPFLPILIAISAAFGTVDLKWLAILMIVLSWAGPVIVVRSMALQISEQLYIEAAKAVGVSTGKIIFKHIFPQIYPYTMAIAVLSIPGIIVAEASLALLGFGDPQAPTWGKMLQLAYNEFAVTNGYWWMYIFPGLALVVFSATFLLVGRAIEPIVAPKLQR